ncbi:MAG: SURF1 family protein [Acidimicrobiia bacterium]
MKAILTPKWIAAHVVVIVIAIVFINLGFWQLGRLEDRQLENQIAESRYNAPPEELHVLLAAAGDDHESLQYRRATVTGSYNDEHELLTRNQVYRDQAGFHVVTPLATGDGGAVLVNRGWVPLPLDTPPIAEAAPPSGEVTATGWINPTQTRPPLGPTDPADGVLDTMNRINIERIQQQMPYDLAPVYLVLEGDGGDQLPVALPPPEFEDEGSHLAYAIQWFGFTVTGVVGYYFLVRKNLRGKA